MKIKFRVRESKFTDRTLIKDVNEKCVPVNYSLDFWQENLKNIFVLTAGNEVVGYIMIEKEKNITTIPDCGVIYSFGVLEKYRRFGNGTKLLTKALEELKKRNMKTILLRVMENNIPAQKLYEKFGFKSIEKLIDYYGKDSDAYLMRLDIIN